MANPNSSPPTPTPKPDVLTREEFLRSALLPEALVSKLTEREKVELVRLPPEQWSPGLVQKVDAYNATVPPQRTVYRSASSLAGRPPAPPPPKSTAA